MLASPLLAGNNLSQLTPEVTAILTNKQVITIDQDPLGKQAERIYTEGPLEIWARPLADGSRALAIFNFGGDETFRAHWSAEVHEEWIRNLLKNRPDITRGKLERTRRLMEQSLPEAIVVGYRHPFYCGSKLQSISQITIGITSSITMTYVRLTLVAMPSRLQIHDHPAYLI